MRPLPARHLHLVVALLIAASPTLAASSCRNKPPQKDGVVVPEDDPGDPATNPGPDTGATSNNGGGADMPPDGDLGGAANKQEQPPPALDLRLVENPDRPAPLNKIKMPAGFEIEYFAKNIDGARSMVRSESGVLFVGTRRTKKLYAILDEDNDGKSDRTILLSDSLSTPNGVALRDGNLYVAEVGRILRFDDIENNLDNLPEPVVVTDLYPEDAHHGWKFIAFGPDGKLYVPVGAPCNVCEEDEIYSTITRIDPDGSNFGIFAHGVRNTVGFTWHPETEELWFTDNGRDRLGDDVPPDELNHAPKKGMHFGFPYCHGGDVKDPDFGDKRPCSDFQPPAQKLGPHVASLGTRFYTGDQFPAGYKNQLLIAEHGSWNRSVPLGYRVTLVTLDEDHKAKGYHVFAEGWLESDGSSWGRPVDVLVLPDGSLLVSDDAGSAIYRIYYKGT